MHIYILKSLDLVHTRQTICPHVYYINKINIYYTLLDDVTVISDGKAVVDKIFDDCDDSSREVVDDNNTDAESDVGSDIVDSTPEVIDIGSRVK